MSFRSYAIVGTGAIGGFYGSLLQKSGFDVHFLVHSDYNHVKKHGLDIRSIKGNFKLPVVNVYNSASLMPRCDVVIVSLKATNNNLLPEIIPNIIGEKGIVFLFQNGFGEERYIAKIPGVKQIIAGLCFICSTKTGPGKINHIDYGAVSLTQYSTDETPCGITPLMQDIADDFKHADISVNYNEDLLLARWKKLVWNIPFNGLSVIFNADTAELVKNQHSKELIIELMRDVVEGAASCGKNIPDSFINKMIIDTQNMKPYYPSMKLDFDAGRNMELQSIYANPLAEAARYGKKLSYIKALYEELMYLQGKADFSSAN